MSVNAKGLQRAQNVNIRVNGGCFTINLHTVFNYIDSNNTFCTVTAIYNNITHWRQVILEIFNNFNIGY